VARLTPLEPGQAAAAVAVLFLLAVLGYWKSTRRAAGVACLAGLFFAGAWVGMAHRPGPRPELDAQARELVILAGCVVQPPVFAEGREQFVLELEPGARTRVNLYPREGERIPGLRYGQRVELEGRARRSHNFRNPGAFDYVAYLARQDIYWTATANAATLRVLEGECGSAFWRVIHGLRQGALERIAALYGAETRRSAMMQAILIGESAGVHRLWTENFRRTGTYHALVISGLHVTVLAGFLLFLLRLCYCPLGPALLATALAGWLYALVSGGQAPVVRAAAGFTMFVVARYFYRRGRLLNLLAAVAIGFLLLDPEQMFEASFQLSFLAVAALGALALPLLERTSLPLGRALWGLADRDRDPHLEPRAAHFRVELRLVAETVELWTRIPQRWVLAAMAVLLRAVFYAWELVAVSAMVQIGLALPLTAYFHRMSLTGLSANVVIVPLMSLVVPLGFAAVLTGLAAPAAVAGGLLGAAQRVADWHAAWEPEWRAPGPPLFLAAGFTAALVALGLLMEARLRWKAAAAGVAAVLLAVIVWHPFPPQVEPGKLELTAIDVGQGESLLVAFPDGKLALVDGGGIPVFGARRRPRLDIGEDVVSAYLWSRSIRRLDVVVMTHAHEDHLGGLAAIVKNFRPRELWRGAAPEEDPAWAELKRQALARGVRIVPLVAGSRFRYGGAEVAVLAPAEGVVASRAQNDDSAVLRMRHGRHSFLLTGDITRRVEAQLEAGKIDVLKVAHHGARDSTSAAFLDAADPAVAIVSAGLDNSYNLPSPEVLERLRERRVAVLRTDRLGLVTVRTDGRRLELDAAAWGSRPLRLLDPF